MPFSSFAQFGAALCETAGVAVPEIKPGPDGMIAFHLVMQDVIVNLAHVDAPGNDDVFVLVTFGVIPQALELEVLRLLSEANFSMLSVSAPVFGLNPATGEVVLRQLVSLSKVDATSAFAAIVQLAELARQWRVNPTLTPVQGDEAAVPPHHFA